MLAVAPRLGGAGVPRLPKGPSKKSAKDKKKHKKKPRELLPLQYDFMHGGNFDMSLGMYPGVRSAAPVRLNQASALEAEEMSQQSWADMIHREGRERREAQSLKRAALLKAPPHYHPAKNYPPPRIGIATLRQGRDPEALTPASNYSAVEAGGGAGGRRRVLAPRAVRKEAEGAKDPEEAAKKKREQAVDEEMEEAAAIFRQLHEQMDAFEGKTKNREEQRLGLNASNFSAIGKNVSNALETIDQCLADGTPDLFKNSTNTTFRDTVNRTENVVEQAYLLPSDFGPPPGLHASPPAQLATSHEPTSSPPLLPISRHDASGYAPLYLPGAHASHLSHAAEQAISGVGQKLLAGAQSASEYLSSFVASPTPQETSAPSGQEGSPAGFSPAPKSLPPWHGDL